MQTDTTFLFPQTVISNGQYTGSPWNNPNNLLSLDGAYASTPATTSQGSDVVVGNFLFNIPQNSIISGIEISFRGYRGVGSSPATVLEIFAYDNTAGNNFFYVLAPQFAGFTTTPTTYYVGSSSYLFNTTWTADQINNLKLRLQANGNVYLDGVQVKVTYQPPAGGSTPTQNVCETILQSQPFRLMQPVSADPSEISWLVDRFQTSDGVDITNAYINNAGIPITTDQGTDYEENGYVTSVTPTVGNQRILTVSRGWSMRDPNTQSGPLRPHGSGAEIIIGNSIQFYDVFLRKCHIGSLVSAPIAAYDEGVSITSYLRSLNFVGSGVVATGAVNPGGGKDVTVTIAGYGVTPPSVNNTTSFNSGGVQVNTITTQHQVSGTDRILLVETTLESTETITAMTYNGTAMTFEGAHNEGDVRVEVWSLIAPALGTHPLVVTFSGLTYTSGNIASFTQVDQTLGYTFDNDNGGNTNTSTGSVTTATDNALVIHSMGTKLVGVAYTNGGGEQIISSVLTGAVQGAMQTQAVGTATTTTTDVFLSSATDWANVLGYINGLQPTIPISQTPIQFQDEGINLGTSGTVDTVDFTGAGVTASRVGNTVTVNIPGSTSTDQYVAVSAADTTPDYLQPKLNIHSSDGSVVVTPTITNPGANEILDIDLTNAGSTPSGGFIEFFSLDAYAGNVTGSIVLAGTDITTGTYFYPLVRKSDGSATLYACTMNSDNSISVLDSIIICGGFAAQDILWAGLCIIGDTIYFTSGNHNNAFFINKTTFNGTSFSAITLFASNMTFSGTAPTLNDFEMMYTDGTYIYISKFALPNVTQFRQYSVSGSVLTYVADYTPGASISNTAIATFPNAVYFGHDTTQYQANLGSSRRIYTFSMPTIAVTSTSGIVPNSIQDPFGRGGRLTYLPASSGGFYTFTVIGISGAGGTNYQMRYAPALP